MIGWVAKRQFGAATLRERLVNEPDWQRRFGIIERYLEQRLLTGAPQAWCSRGQVAWRVDLAQRRGLALPCGKAVEAGSQGRAVGRAGIVTLVALPGGLQQVRGDGQALSAGARFRRPATGQGSLDQATPGATGRQQPR